MISAWQDLFSSKIMRRIFTRNMFLFNFDWLQMNIYDSKNDFLQLQVSRIAFWIPNRLVEWQDIIHFIINLFSRDFYRLIMWNWWRLTYLLIDWNRVNITHHSFSNSGNDRWKTWLDRLELLLWSKKNPYKDYWMWMEY